jgi:fibronectin type 3 domain-containing protein
MQVGRLHLERVVVMCIAVLWLEAGLRASDHHHIDLSWQASTSTDVIGYNVYRGTRQGGPYTKLNSSPIRETRYVDGDVRAGQTYFYVIRAVNGKGVESTPSGEVKAKTPSDSSAGP